MFQFQVFELFAEHNLCCGRAIDNPQTFETMGTVRDARGLASSTYTLSSHIAYWIFIKPTTLSFMAIFFVYSVIVSQCFFGIDTGGMTQAESPE